MNPQVYERYAEVTSNDQLKDDFINVAALVTFARNGLENKIYSEKVILALRYAYELINDIQAWSLPQIGDDLSVRNKFAASFTLELHDQAIIINEWIATHLKQ